MEFKKMYEEKLVTAEQAAAAHFSAFLAATLSNLLSEKPDRSL